jgi:hypothetical protein
MGEDKKQDEGAATAGAGSQTSGGKVMLVMHDQQAFTSVVELDGYSFRKGEAVEVPKAKAEKLLQRRDEHGRKYVKEA